MEQDLKARQSMSAVDTDDTHKHTISFIFKAPREKDTHVRVWVTVRRYDMPELLPVDRWTVILVTHRIQAVKIKIKQCVCTP
jgi:hypothetical protein